MFASKAKNQSSSLECIEDKTEAREDWRVMLFKIGMEKYIQLFTEKNYDTEKFLQISDYDLRVLKINKADRDIILNSLKLKKKQVNKSHLDDLIIARNILNQLSCIRDYCFYIQHQMVIDKLTDFRINSSETAKDYLKTFAVAALEQTKLLKERILPKQNNKSEKELDLMHMVNHGFVPPYWNKKEENRKKRVLLGLIAIVGISASVFLITKRLLNG